MIRETTALAFGQAFNPDPIDRKVTLAERFQEKPLLAVTLLQSSLEASILTFDDDDLPRLSQTEHFDIVEPDQEHVFLRGFATKHGLTEVVVNLQHGFQAAMTSRARIAATRAENIDLQADAPDKLIGENCKANTMYALVPHPTHNYALQFEYKKSDLDRIVMIMTKANLSVVHFHCGMVDLLNYVLTKHWAEVKGDTAFVFVDRAAVFTCLLEPKAIGHPGFAMQVAPQDLREEIVARLHEIVRSGTHVILVNDSDLNVGEMIAERELQNPVSTPLKGVADPELFATCSDVHPAYAYDLCPTIPSAKPYAPRSYRVVPMTFWSVVLLAILCMITNGIRTYRATKATERADQKKQEVMLDMASIGIQMTALQERQVLAEGVRDWVALSPGTQDFLVNLNTALEGPALVQNISMQRVPGQPQMRLVINLSATEKDANDVFNRVTAMLGSAGYKTIDLKSFNVPGGFQYDHLLNNPSQ